MLRQLPIFLYIFTALLAAGLPPALARSAFDSSPEHVAVLFILDDSGSMQENDPTGLRYTSAGMFTAALDPGDRVGAVRFASSAQAITEGMVTISGQGDKLGIIRLLQPVQNDGYTDIRAAFSTAKILLAPGCGAGCRPVIVFLTDGKPETPNLSPSYLKETKDIAVSLSAPVYAVALTREGQTAFLSGLAQATGGQVFTAASATDVLDRFLSILGELKDRTITGQGVVNAPGEENITIDAALAPYIHEVTFMIAHEPGITAQLFAPDGNRLSGGMRIEDPRFTAVTLSTPQGGPWIVRLAGSGSARVRAIMHSRLRARALSPLGLIEAGKPVPLVVNLLEEQPDGKMVKIVGDAAFSARVTLPDGSQESLDRFYDDGIHGDAQAEDGDYTRLLVNTRQAGAYQLSLSGLKGPVPVGTEAQFGAVKFPEIVIDSPRAERYDLHSGDPGVPLAIHLEGASPSQFEGGFAAQVQTPSGQVDAIDLAPGENGYYGIFQLFEDGAYTVIFRAKDGTFLGLPYQREASAAFSVRRIPGIQIASVKFLKDVARFENEVARTGVPVEVTFHSTVSKPIELIASLAELPGFEIQEEQPLKVIPGAEYKLILHLIYHGQNEPASEKWQGSLRFEPVPDSPVDLQSPVVPIQFETYTPAVSFETRIISQCTPGRCWQWLPVQLLIKASSTSEKIERLKVRLDGLPNTELNQSWIEVPPGDSEMRVILYSTNQNGIETSFRPGAYRGSLVVLEPRAGLKISPGNGIPLAFSVGTPLQTCQTPLIISGGSVLVLGMIIFRAVRSTRAKTQQPRVKGTLAHWPKNAPDRQQTVDLSGMKKEEVTIGAGSQCDVFIADSGVTEIHARIYAERGEGSDIRCMMAPLGSVMVGYRPRTAPFELLEDVKYQIGDQVFTYTRDPEV